MLSLHFETPLLKCPLAILTEEMMPPTKILIYLALGHFPSSIIVKAELAVLPRELLSLNCISIVLKRWIPSTYLSLC